jgi:hypothetical protein
MAARLRESGLIVYGFGERKTPKPFVAACDRFIYIENITYIQSAAPSKRNQSPTAQLRGDAVLVDQLRNAIEAPSPMARPIPPVAKESL